MQVDESQVIFDSRKLAFKNNNIYTGSFNVSGTVVAGLSQRNTTITLDAVPDMTQILFNAPTDSSDPRPANGWFEEGYVWILGDGSVVGANYSTNWAITTSFTGAILTITLTYNQQFNDTLTLHSTPVYYRIVDYSVFST